MTGIGGEPRFRHCVPRSNDSQPRSCVERQTRSLLDGVRRVVSLFLSPGLRRARLDILMAAFFVSVLPTFDFSVSVLFEMNHPLCWTVAEIGTFTGVSLAISVVSALIATPLMKRCATDWHIAVMSSVGATITYVYRFFVRDSLMMYLCMFRFSLCPFSSSGIFSRITSTSARCGLLLRMSVRSAVCVSVCLSVYLCMWP